ARTVGGRAGVSPLLLQPARRQESAQHDHVRAERPRDRRRRHRRLRALKSACQRRRRDPARKRLRRDTRVAAQERTVEAHPFSTLTGWRRVEEFRMPNVECRMSNAECRMSNVECRMSYCENWIASAV